MVRGEPHSYPFENKTIVEQLSSTLSSTAWRTKPRDHPIDLNNTRYWDALAVNRFSGSRLITRWRLICINDR